MHSKSDAYLKWQCNLKFTLMFARRAERNAAPLHTVGGSWDWHGYTSRWPAQCWWKCAHQTYCKHLLFIKLCTGGGGGGGSDCSTSHSLRDSLTNINPHRNVSCVAQFRQMIMHSAEVFVRHIWPKIVVAAGACGCYTDYGKFDRKFWICSEIDWIHSGRWQSKLSALHTHT